MNHEKIVISLNDVQQSEEPSSRIILSEDVFNQDTPTISQPKGFVPSVSPRTSSMKFPIIFIGLGGGILLIVGILLVFLMGIWSNPNTSSGNSAQTAQANKDANMCVVMVTMEAPSTGFWNGLLRGHEAGIGSGTVLAKNGGEVLILTNRHVVSDSIGNIAPKLAVCSRKGDVVQARVVALPKDDRIDLALIVSKSLSELKPVWKIEHSRKLQPGDRVIAIGHPEGLSFSLTDGICSAKRPQSDGIEIIQHTAFINHGNSGGPLLDAHRNLVGVNSFLIKGTQGIFFAFPAEIVLSTNLWDYRENIQPFLKQIKEN